jgi:hypothetical protein
MRQSYVKYNIKREREREREYRGKQSKKNMIKLGQGLSKN